MLDKPIVNPGAINELADFIESAKYSFDMGQATVHPECGSAGCIGGHAALLWSEIRAEYDKAEGSYSWSRPQLQAKLGITNEQEQELCFPSHMGVMTIHRKEAVKTLRKLALTGVVDWDDWE